MICEGDHAILKAFIHRESTEYNWKDGIEGEAAREFRSRMFVEITGRLTELNVGCDFICIQSLTNMGLVSAELRLSARRLDYSQNVVVSLPNSPRGWGVGVSIIEKDGLHEIQFTPTG